MGNNEPNNGLVSYEDMSPGLSVLPKDYVLGRNDVMCGRGKRSYLHSGNKRLRKIIRQNLDRYYGAPNKSAKSTIIHEIVTEVRNDQPPGHFVKYEPLAGRYYEVKPLKAQEKVSHAFRDALNVANKGRPFKPLTRHVSTDSPIDQCAEPSFSSNRIRSHNNPTSCVTQLRTIDDQTNYSTIGLQERCSYTPVDQTVSNHDDCCIHQSFRRPDTVTLNENNIRRNPMNENIRLHPTNCLQQRLESQPVNCLQQRLESQSMNCLQQRLESQARNCQQQRLESQSMNCLQQRLESQAMNCQQQRLESQSMNCLQQRLESQARNCLQQRLESQASNCLQQRLESQARNCLQHSLESQRRTVVVEEDFLSSIEVFNKMEMRYRWDDDPFEPCPIRE